MRLLLDTTYFLPIIGISIKEIPYDSLVRLIKEGYRILLSEVSIFELLAKGAKYISLGLLTPNRVYKGVNSIMYDDRLGKVPIYSSTIILTSFELRRMLNDYIDCLILSSAIERADALVTEDIHIHKLSRDRDFKRIISDINPEFDIKHIRDLI